jgi:hypothetical protein
MKVVVIGGTGLIGSKVVEKLKQKGHEAIAASPNTGVNTITGEGLNEAMARLGGRSCSRSAIPLPRSSSPGRHSRICASSKHQHLLISMSS